MARNEDNSFVVTHSQVMYYPAGNLPEKEKVKRDFTVARYRKRPDIQVNKPDPSGFRAPSAYYTQVRTRSPIVGMLNYEQANPREAAWRTDCNAVGWSVLPSNFDALPPSLESELKVRCLRKVRDSSVNLAQTLAFMGPTLNMIWQRLISIAEVLDAVKARDWKKVYRLLRVPGYSPGKRTADYTLEVQFGWRQLIADVVGLCETLEKGLRDEHMFVYGKAGVKSAKPLWNRRDGFYTTYKIGDVIHSGTVEEFHSMTMVFKVRNPAMQLLSQIGLTNPAVLAWDIIPWSFVVNWVIPIGDWLESIDATVGLEYAGGTYSRGVRLQDGTVTVLPSYDRKYKGRGLGEGSFAFFNYKREVISQFVNPFYLKNPFRGGIVRAITATALVAQKASSMRV